MKTTPFLIILLAGATALSACGGNKNQRIAFDGKYFRTKVAKVDGQRDEFTVTVRDVAQSPDGARAAARHEATAYCVGNYGSSAIDWTVGPDTPGQQLRIVDNTLTFRGTCPQ
jgi:hypothetical protein